MAVPSDSVYLHCTRSSVRVSRRDQHEVEREIVTERDGHPVALTNQVGERPWLRRSRPSGWWLPRSPRYGRGVTPLGLGVERRELGEQGLEEQRLVREALERQGGLVDAVEAVDHVGGVAGVDEGVAVHAREGGEREAQLGRAVAADLALVAILDVLLAAPPLAVALDALLQLGGLLLVAGVDDGLGVVDERLDLGRRARRPGRRCRRAGRASPAARRPARRSARRWPAAGPGRGRRRRPPRRSRRAARLDALGDEPLDRRRRAARGRGRCARSGDAIVTSSGGTSSARITKKVDAGGSSTYFSRMAPNWSMRWKSSSTSTLRLPSAGRERRLLDDLPGRRRVDAALRGGGLHDVEVGVRLGEGQAHVALGLLALGARRQQQRGERPGGGPLARTRRARRAGRRGRGGPPPAVSWATAWSCPTTSAHTSSSAAVVTAASSRAVRRRITRGRGSGWRRSPRWRRRRRPPARVPSTIAQRSGSAMAWARKPSWTRAWNASPADSSRSFVRARRASASCGDTSSSTIEVGPQAVGGPPREPLDLLGAELAAVPLVGDRRAGEAVGDHRLARPRGRAGRPRRRAGPGRRP